jgi:glycosyltransferase involved in cell wall biosynthesis
MASHRYAATIRSAARKNIDIYFFGRLQSKGAWSMTPLKIVHLAYHIRHCGNGIVNVIIDLAIMQSEAGHEVIVAGGEGDFKALLEQHGVKVILLPQEPRLKLVPAMLKRFNKLVSEFKPDIVHVHMMTGVLLAKASRMHRKYKIISTVHNEWQKTAILMGLADRVVGVSDVVTQKMRRRGVSPERLRTILNGTIGTPRTESMARPDTPVLRHPNIVTVAGMFHRKGISTIIKAFADLPEGNHLYLVGDGPDLQEFEALSLKTGKSNSIHFLGFRSDIPDILKQTDVFTLMSRQEPFALVLLEAREAGCAIIASDVDGIPQALDGTGVLLPPDNVEMLTEAFNTMLTDPTVRKEWQVRAKTKLELFTTKRLCDEYIELYREALGK